MTIYGRFNKDAQTLEVVTDGSYSRGYYEVAQNGIKNKTVARKAFIDYLRKGFCTSPAEFEGDTIKYRF